MPFDPSYPPLNAEIESAPLRDQFTSLKALIDAVPGITGVVLDGVTTGNPGDPASVNLSIVGTELHFSFTIPRGIDGMTPLPVTSFLIDSVTTLSPGAPASASALFDGTSVKLTFGIPRGFDGNNGTNGIDGTNGTNGTNGNDGQPGAQGPPGEVSNADLTPAINGTSSNTNTVATFPNTAAASYDQTQQQALIDKVNELINVLRR
jgi:hypothetical protein